MSRLTKIAKKALATGKYTPLDDIILRYPNGVEVNGITVKALKNQSNAIVFTFNDGTTITNDETGEVINNDTASYFPAESGDLKKLVTAWQGEGGMTIDEIDAELKDNPVTLRIYKMQTRNGRDYVKVHVIDNDDTGADSDDTITIENLEKALDNIKKLISEKEIERDKYNDNGNSAVAARWQKEIEALNQKKEKLESLLYQAQA